MKVLKRNLPASWRNNIKYYLTESAFAAESADAVVVSTVTGADKVSGTVVMLSVVIVVESVEVVVSELLLQAVRAPAIARIANNFFMCF
jgi:hypothetical protein